MDEEKMQRQMEFILDQQAQFAVHQTQSAARLSQLEDLLVRFAQATRERFEAADRRSQEIDGKLAALVNAQIRTEDKGPDIDRRIAALVDAQIRTEETVRKMGEDISRMGEKIDNLTAVVDRHIVEGHNGKARPEG